MSAFAPYRLMTEEEAPAARLGLVVLQTDEVLETDLRRLFEPDAIALHITRIPSGAEVTPEAL
ncbi:MAG: Asp/Glu racemase, partial [Pseudomonadota bacterium]